MAVLGSGVLMLSATATGFQKDMKAAESSVDAFNKKVKAVPEIGEKLNAGIGRIQSVSGVFQTMSSDANVMEKAIAGASGGVASLTVGLQLATKVATGLKAAMLGTGIGALIVGLGYLLQKLQNAADSGARAAAAIPPGVAFARETTPTRSLSFGEGVDLTLAGIFGGMSADEIRGVGDALRGFPSRIEAIGTALGGIAPRTVEVARSLEAASESTEEFVTRSRRHRDAMIATAPATILASDAFRVYSMSVDSAIASLRRASLRRELEDMRRETERVRTPLERVGVELERISTIARRSGDFDRFRRGIDAIIAIPPTSLEAVRTRVDTVVAAFDTSIREFERRRASRGIFDIIMGRPLATFDSGPFRRALEALSGDADGALTTFRNRLREIDTAREALTRVSTRRGFFPIPLPGEMERFDRGAGRAFLDLERSLGTFERMAPAALVEGSVEAIAAINAARRNATSADPILRVERVLERLERIEEAERRELEGIGRALGRIRRV